MKITNKLTSILFAATFAMAATNAIAGGRMQITAPKRVEISSNSNDASMMRDRIVNAAKARTWVVEKDSPGELILKIVVRQKHTVVIKSDYDARGYTFSYVSSINMDYKKKSNGKEYIHSSYHRWLDLLTADIKA